MESKPKPKFPNRAVVTAGMPYGDKHLHLGHVGGNFIHADIYARFLRDRIGKDNVIFVSGTDCYGAGIDVKHQAAKSKGFEGSICDFVEGNHHAQKKVLDAYGISLDLYAASALPPAADIHSKLSAELFNKWYENGYLRLEEIEQFFDEETQTFLNGRQVEGRCPIAKCKSETAYADECSLGHQYNPKDLIAPKAVTNGLTPALRKNTNWYFDLKRFGNDLKQQQINLKEEGIARKNLLAYIEDFLKDPVILIKTDDFDNLQSACSRMPEHTAKLDENDQSATLTFSVLKDREMACEILREHGIRFRTGTTLVPFRLTGNVSWGISVPEKENIKDQTFWVWPESLWAPISFVKSVLEKSGNASADWEHWWSDSEAQVYQFIGEDNIYFYGIAEMGLFMALNEISGRERLHNLPMIIPNRHVFFGNKKASSSGAVAPPSAAELLNHYTVEQLRMHFAHMALQSNSVKFLPKALMTGKDSEGFDTTLAEGNILTNVYNRIVRSCFYSLQKYYGGILPANSVSSDIKGMSDELIHEFEWAMYRFEFSKVIDMIDVYLRNINKIWVSNTKNADVSNDEALRAQTLIDTFHAVKVTAVLMHPFAPEGTERIREYLQFDERLWNWEYINEPLGYFMKKGHTFKFLEPKIDFFAKHPSQLKD